ncbi:GPR107 protein [Hibiscus syriacus]|uniref:GPR107 protein n=1 Tax=Hibiscus syriacus TaxID=106335 RepID=A0A6A2WQX1_HIBSY|nr:two-component response regulator ARR22-like [Hibiscus syriacus]KAE8663283.1 GPR107 protein [Hibiscus syriacus]
MVLGKASSSSFSMKSDDDNNLTVLVVDDSPMIRKLHDMHFKKFGHKVQVDLFRFGDSFDLILMDKEMPVMDGAEATKELRAMGVKSMIAGVTSLDSPYDKQVFMEAGLDYCFNKPLTADNISFLLQELNKKNGDKIRCCHYQFG